MKTREVLRAWRIGDFYEFFGAEAVLASKALGLTLSARGGCPLAGIPHHQLDRYADRFPIRHVGTFIAEPPRGDYAGAVGAMNGVCPIPGCGCGGFLTSEPKRK